MKLTIYIGSTEARQVNDKQRFQLAAVEAPAASSEASLVAAAAHALAQESTHTRSCWLGSSDQVALQAVAARCGRDPATEGTAVVPMGGENIRRFLELLGPGVCPDWRACVTAQPIAEITSGMGEQHAPTPATTHRDVSARTLRRRSALCRIGRIKRWIHRSQPNGGPRHFFGDAKYLRHLDL